MITARLFGVDIRDWVHTPIDWRDASALTLLASNAFVFVLVLLGRVSMSDVLFIYLIQGVVIGCVHLIKLFFIKTAPIDPTDLSPREQLNPLNHSKGGLAVHFLYSYLFTHFLFFLIIEGMFEPVSYSNAGLIVAISAFAVHHAFSLILNVRKDTEEYIPARTAVYYPSMRVLPLFAVILIPSLVSAVWANETLFIFAVFVALKTYVDLKLHSFEHNVVFKKKRV